MGYKLHQRYMIELSLPNTLIIGKYIIATFGLLINKLSNLFN